MFGEHVSVCFVIDKLLSQLTDITQELLRFLGPVPSQNRHLNGEEFLGFVIVDLELMWFFYFPPNIINILHNFTPNLALVVVLVIEIPDAEQDSFGRLLLELGNAYIHDDLQSFVLGTIVLAQRLSPDVDNQHIGCY